MKRKFMIGIYAVLAGFFLAVTFKGHEIKGQEIAAGISDEVIRLHVIANSDREEDQMLKLKVKEEIVTYLEKILKDTDGNEMEIDKVREEIQLHLGDVEKIAEDYIEKEGYDYTVKAELGEFYFPTKTYGDLTFPPGEYEALRIRIGKAEGKNWWCVVYPPLCFVDAAHGKVPEESKEKLKNVLTEEEYDSLFQKGDEEKVTVKVKFKLAELFKEWF
jgi:stage II sporulation protein R